MRARASRPLALRRRQIPAALCADFTRYKAHFYNADLSAANMENGNLLEGHFQGVKLIKRRLISLTPISKGTELSNTDLTNIPLTSTNLRGC